MRFLFVCEYFRICPRRDIPEEREHGKTCEHIGCMPHFDVGACGTKHTCSQVDGPYECMVFSPKTPLEFTLARWTDTRIRMENRDHIHILKLHRSELCMFHRKGIDKPASDEVCSDCPWWNKYGECYQKQIDIILETDRQAVINVTRVEMIEKLQELVLEECRAKKKNYPPLTVKEMIAIISDWPWVAIVEERDVAVAAFLKDYWYNTLMNNKHFKRCYDNMIAYSCQEATNIMLKCYNDPYFKDKE